MPLVYDAQSVVLRRCRVPLWSLLRRILSKYPFADVGGFDGFFPWLNRFFMDEAFTAWFYRRGLELLFVGLIRFAFDFSGQVSKGRDERCIVGG